MSCKGCYTCKHTRLDADEEPCITCKHSGNAEGQEDNWEPKDPPTNAERIRMMSDEELAAIAALEKQAAKKPVDRCMFKECPTCGSVDIASCGYCPECGQKLDWSDEE